jgi:hypothetical protein
VFGRASGVAAAIGLLALIAGGLSGCSSKSTGSAGAPTITETHTNTRSASVAPSTASTYVVPPAATVGALGSAHAAMPAGEVEGTCPYIANQDFADLEGDRVYRTSTLTTLKPVGCRFYFWAGPFEAIGDIMPATLATPTDAYNAMVATGAAGTGTIGVKDLAPGVDAVLYKTSYFGPDNAKGGDWACAFAKGNVMVIVHTQQTNVSYNARAIAAAIVGKF